jgi:hypothetical protein
MSATNFRPVTDDPHTAPNLGMAALITIDTQREVLDGGPLETPGEVATASR